MKRTGITQDMLEYIPESGFHQHDQELAKAMYEQHVQLRNNLITKLQEERNKIIREGVTVQEAELFPELKKLARNDIDMGNRSLQSSLR